MNRALRSLPSLDFLRGFEAAGRRLSFTLAAQELFPTQSALSRQVKALEESLGIALFERRHRALTLTTAGTAFHRSVSEMLAVLMTATERTRGDVDVAVRYLPDAAAPGSALRLFGERMTPVASPRAVRGRARLRSPRDLARHVLLHFDEPEGRTPWLDWNSWFASNGEPGLKAAGSLRFRLYDQVIQAAVGGQGVALGRLPMIAEHLRDGRLVAPFARRFDTARGYFAIRAPHAAEREDVGAFPHWVGAEAASECEAAAPKRAHRNARN